MPTVEPSLVSTDVKMFVVVTRVKGRQGGEGVYSDNPPESVLSTVFRSTYNVKLWQKTCFVQQHALQL